MHSQPQACTGIVEEELPSDSLHLIGNAAWTPDDRNDMYRNDPAAPTQPLATVRRPGAGFRGLARHVLDAVAPPAQDRQLLVKMGCGRPSLIGDRRTLRVTEAYHLL